MYLTWNSTGFLGLWIYIVFIKFLSIISLNIFYAFTFSGSLVIYVLDHLQLTHKSQSLSFSPVFSLCASFEIVSVPMALH